MERTILPEIIRPVYSSSTGPVACRVALGLTAYLSESGFWATEGARVDPSHSVRCPSNELTLSAEAPPEHLLALAEQLAATGHVAARVRGFVVRWIPSHPKITFSRFFQWARRFSGLDVQITDTTAHSAAQFLPTTN